MDLDKNKIDKMVVYIRGGLGDVWPAICATKKIQEEYKISKFNTIVFTDSVYYFRNYPHTIERMSLDMIRKLTPNVIEISPSLNRDFWLDKNGEIFDDTTEELSQEEANKFLDEFMFWRPPLLRKFVGQNVDEKTLFIDALCTECILMWDWDKNKYVRVSNDRNTFVFKPTRIIREFIDDILKTNKKHVLIHVRKKEEGDAHKEGDNFFNDIIEFCNSNDIKPILMGVDDGSYKGKFINLMGDNILYFEEMAYLIDKCKVMLGNDSGFTSIKLYQQQKDKLTICNHPRWERTWFFNAITKDKSLWRLYNAKENNLEKIKKDILNYYNKNGNTS